MANYAKTNIGNEGRVELHYTLSLTGAEISINDLPAGANVPFVHSHKNNEEVYGILSGKGKVIIDGEEIALTAGDWVRIAPVAKRQFFAAEDEGISFEHMPSGIDTMTIFVHQDEFEEHEQKVLAGIHRAVNPDDIELESDLALIAVVGRGMRQTRGTAGRIFSALAHAHVNVKMIDQGSSELNIIIGVREHDFEAAIKAIYDIFVNTQL